jgi:hypothetical protein
MMQRGGRPSRVARCKLWVSHPIYTQVMYCLDQVPKLVEKQPHLKGVEPFKTVLSGDREAIR